MGQHALSSEISTVGKTGAYDDLTGKPDLTTKQNTLVSGTNIKTINGTSVLGSGYLTVSANLTLDVYRTSPAYFCDFAGLASANNIDPFSGVAVASGTLNGPNAGLVTANHPGVIRIRSSTTTNSGYFIGFNTSQILIGGGEYYEASFNPTVFTDTTLRMGFIDTVTSSDVTDGAYIEVSTAGVATGKTANSSTRSSTGTTYTLTAGTYYRARIAVNAAGTLVTFTIYSDAGTVLWTDTLATNIPTAAGRETGAGIISTNVGTTAVDLLHLDYQLVAFGNGRNLVR